MRWCVELHADTKGIKRFQLDLFPAPGMLFEVDDHCWRIVEVMISVQGDSELSKVVVCEVELAGRWS